MAQLAAFSRQQDLVMRVLDLNETLSAMRGMLGQLIREDIHIEYRLADDLGRIEADPGQLTNAVLNLTANSRDAMPAGGTLIIETENVDIDPTSAAGYLDIEPGPHVMLAISDTGEGMTPEVQEHLFEPFFTTKPQGEGTGFGLATVYGVVTQCRGSIRVYSEVGQGTTFKIYFPRVDKPETANYEDRVAALPTGTETILLVEDDDAVRHLAIRMLQQLGYSVLEAHGPAEALELFRDRKESVALVLTDIVMPEMSGEELVTQLRGLHADLAVLFMSGYTREMIRHGGSELGARLLAKPLEIDQVAHRVREALDESRT